MTLPENSRTKAIPRMSKDAGLTPHQLVQHQVENFDYHVSDEDMANMKISTDLTDEEEVYAVDEAAELKKDGAGTPYDVLD